MIKDQVEYLNDQIKSYILSSLYLQVIDTLGSKYMCDLYSASAKSGMKPGLYTAWQ